MQQNHHHYRGGSAARPTSESPSGRQRVSCSGSVINMGRLKVREWKMREHIARVENGGVSRMESQTENIFSVTTILTAIRF